MGMMVWSHQAVGIKYHTHLYGLKERHAIHHDMSDHELEIGLQFSSIVTSNTENEAYAEYTMELYHGYGCHCLPGTNIHQSQFSELGLGLGLIFQFCLF